MSRTADKWYADLFRGGFYHRWALPERFQHAEAEVGFIVEALSLPPDAAVLDLCCGEGRHTVELARRGYRMSGLDLSAFQLRLARRAAREAGVQVRWHRSDMRDIPWRGEFDAVINMFTAFGYFESDEEDAKVLTAAAGALKPGGRLLLDTINREWLMRHWEPHGWRESDDGMLALEDRSFDSLRGRNSTRILSIRPDGKRQEHRIELRLYTLKELADLLAGSGLGVRGAWGGFDGQEYGMDSRRMIVLAEKEGVA